MGSASISTMEELGNKVSTNATILTNFLRSNSWAEPSFDRNSPTTTLPATAPENIRVARQSLIEASLKIFQLAIGPSEFLPNLAVGVCDFSKPLHIASLGITHITLIYLGASFSCKKQYQYIACLRWLCHFNIFYLVPLKHKITYSELAAAAEVPEQRLKSVVRMAMTTNIFLETEPNEVSHSVTSALIADDPNFYAWATYMCETSAPAASKLVEASVKWPASFAKHETSYNIAFDTDLPFFDHIALNSEKMKQFTRYMKNVTSSEGTAINHVLTGFDWAILGKAVIVDVSSYPLKFAP